MVVLNLSLSALSAWVLAGKEGDGIEQSSFCIKFNGESFDLQNIVKKKLYDFFLYL
jgi:hypothetical protein